VYLTGVGESLGWGTGLGKVRRRVESVMGGFQPILQEIQCLSLMLLYKVLANRLASVKPCDHMMLPGSAMFGSSAVAVLQPDAGPPQSLFSGQPNDLMTHDHWPENTMSSVIYKAASSGDFEDT
jgi:hypothetical protein